jgi:hypothetical protein
MSLTTIKKMYILKVMSRDDLIEHKKSVVASLLLKIISKTKQ